jgi:hypothetical protein
MTTKPKTRKAPDRTSLSGRYRISRLRNALILSQKAIGDSCVLTQDLAQIGMEVFRVYETIGLLIEALNAAEPAKRAPRAARAKGN